MASFPFSASAALIEKEEEEGVGQECQELLRSLPQEKGWRTAHIYQYQGFWVAGKLIESIIEIQQNFRVRDTDVLLVTTPKSGTVWLKALAFAIMNRNRYSFSENPLLNTNPHELVPFLEHGVFISNKLPYLSTLPSPRLFASHIPYPSLSESIKTNNCRIVYQCRNPKDMFVSLFLFSGKLRPENLGPLSLDQAFELFCKGAYEFGPYWDHVLGFWKESFERPQKSLEVNKTGKLMPRGDNAVFFRKGEVGDWMNHLSPEMAEKIDKITEVKLLGSGLSFQVASFENETASAS
ncbi:cytosolic sulfotransferase 15-like [Telopea speciosissima]|uniref:cytosolic sulfotransferase 15-like n=1 Tax=Telopea speciosissima TaxID=54955 RepID=UPI001CC48B18|nr:cytosolic sulfotransferase 15-like [Telopea speciosissima]